MAQRTPTPPPVLAGFTYVRPLGSGGFADVFLYEQDMPRRVVAVKVLKADAINPDVLRLFNAEADVMARLSAHPSVLTIYQASISSDGRPYLATEYCTDSMGLRYKQGPLELPLVLDTGVRMAAALETAHRAGLLHRDIKPSNILITTLGTPVLADFGIAMSLGGVEDTEDFFAMSVPWSSPEALQETTTGTVASEVWSLGATLYTFLAGRSPFASPDRAKNSTDQMLARINKAAYTSLGRADVPIELESLLSRAMSRDPGKRPQSMLEFAGELRWIQQMQGFPPTTIEVAASEWAAATPVSFASGAPRGPVMSTVNKDSRRAKRASQTPIGSAAQAEVTPARPATSPIKAAVIGAVVGAVALAIIGGLVLVLTGVIG